MSNPNTQSNFVDELLYQHFAERKRMSVIAIIPARYASTRFPGKPLVELLGKTMLERVWLAAQEARRIDAVAIATDDERIAAECKRIGAECVMTSSDLLSGTDRVAQAMQLSYPNAEIVLNVQGDEPLLRGELLDALVEALQNSDADVATPIKRITTEGELDNPTVCKVTLRNDNTALYFSRSTIPHLRGVAEQERLEKAIFWKHIGIYAYRRAALERFITLPPHALELAESLEQLRLLADGAPYLCVESNMNLVAIDTPEDAERVRELLLIPNN